MESRNNEQPNLSDLQDELLLRIGSLSSASGFYHLVRTSKQLSSLCFFKDYRQALEPLKQLLNHAALGEWEAAEEIWSKEPALLTCCGTIYHRNPAAITPEMNPGRYKYVNCTAYQIALMNEEYEEAEKMGKHLTQEGKQRQFAEIFPDGQVIKYNWDLKKAIRLLEAVFAEVINDPLITEKNLDVMSESTRAALTTLYAYVKPLPEHKTGLVFDANSYVEALKLYEERYDEFKSKNSYSKRSFWCIRVEEHLASLLGTGYLRPHAQGICNKLKRTGCKLRDGSSYFAFRRRRASGSIPGFHIFVDVCGGRSRRASLVTDAPGGGFAVGVRSWFAGFFQKLCRAKKRAGRELMRQYFRPNKSACLGC